MPAAVPEYIQFFPSLNCNRECAFCFNRGLEAEDEIGTGDFRIAADKIRTAGIREIDLLGGEPTLHPDIVQLIDISSELGLRLNLSTNGTNVALLELLSRTYDKKILNIGISLDAGLAEKRLEDYIARYRPAVKNIFKKTTFARSANICSDLPGVDRYLLYMDTVSRSHLEDSVPFSYYYKQLCALRDRYPNVAGVYCGGFIPDTEKHPFLKAARCPAGITKLSVLPDGSVYPCYLFFRHREFRLGNILTESIEHILKNPALEFFRRFDGNKCPDTTCELFQRCRGGCPAISLLILNDIEAPDPRCIR